MLLHLQSLAKRKQPLNIRVDLRVRGKAGFPIYALDDVEPLPGTLTQVTIQRDKVRGGRRKYLCWWYVPDPGVKVPSATPGYARVVLGPTSGNYFLMQLGGVESPSSASPEPPEPARS